MYLCNFEIMIVIRPKILIFNILMKQYIIYITNLFLKYVLQSNPFYLLCLITFIWWVLGIMRLSKFTQLKNKFKKDLKNILYMLVNNI